MELELVFQPGLSCLSQALTDEGHALPGLKLWRSALFRQYFESEQVFAIQTKRKKLCVIAGFYPGSDHYELWMLAGPALRGNEIRALRLGRAAMAAALNKLAPRASVISLVRLDLPSAPRMARLVGLQSSGEIVKPMPGVKVEKYYGRDCRR